jgi:MFS family permease
LTGARAVWRVVIVLGVAQLGFAVILPLLPIYLTEQLDASVKLVGIVVATFALTETLFKTAWGGVADRWGRKPIMVAGLALSATVPVVMAVLRAPALFVPLRLVDGMGSAALWPSAAAAVADVTTPDRRASGMAMLNMAFLCGLAIGPSLGLFVAGFTGDVRAGFFLASGLLALAAVVAAAAFPSGRAPASGIPAGAEFRSGVRAAYLDAIRASFRASPVLFSLYLIAFVQMFGIGLLVPIAPIYAVQVVGLSKEAIGMLFLAMTVSVALATLPAGRLADRLGRPRLILAGMAIGAAGMWIIPLSRHLAWLLAAGVLLGASYALVLPAWLALVTELAPPGRLGADGGCVGDAAGPGSRVWPAAGRAAVGRAGSAGAVCGQRGGADSRGDHGRQGAQDRPATLTRRASPSACTSTTPPMTSAAPIHCAAPNGSRSTRAPPSAATTGSSVATTLARPASTHRRPPMYRRYAIAVGPTIT